MSGQPPFINGLLARTVSVLQGIMGDEWEANVVLRHKGTGQALTAGVSDPALMIDAITITLADKDGFVGRLNTETGEIRPGETGAVQ